MWKVRELKPWEKFWKLTFIEVVEWERKHGYRVIRCKCDCGNEKKLTMGKWGVIMSCWCMLRTHNNLSYTPEYRAWNKLWNRCYCKKMDNYEKYGGSWIKVWFKNFEEFLAEIWPKPWKGYTVDRIDNSKGYEPWNVRRATMKEQENNRSNNLMCCIDWEEHTLQQRAEKLWMWRETLKRRIKRWAINWVLYYRFEKNDVNPTWSKSCI